MTADALTDLMIAALIRAHGGSRRRWRIAIGALRIHDARTHPHCNWSVAPGGSATDVAAIEDLLDDVRLRHPIVVAN